jgi:hypothetical protein
VIFESGVSAGDEKTSVINEAERGGIPRRFEIGDFGVKVVC